MRTSLRYGALAMVLALTVAASFAIRNTLSTLEEQKARSQDRAERLADLIMLRGQQTLQETKRTLTVLSGFSSLDVAVHAACGQFFRRQLESLPAYRNLGMAREKEESVCAATPPTQTESATLRGIMSLAGKSLTIRADQARPVLMLAMPDAGNSNYIFAVRSIDQLQLFPKGYTPEHGTRLAFRDSLGTWVTYQNDGAAWRKIANGAGNRFDTTRPPAGGHASLDRDMDGIRRLYVSRRIDLAPENFEVMIGVPADYPALRHILYAEWASVAALLAAFLGISGVGTDRFLQRQLKAAAQTTFPRLARRARQIGDAVTSAGRFIHGLSPAGARHRRTPTELHQANVRLSRSIEQLKRRTFELATLNELGQLLQMCTRSEEIAPIVTRFAQTLFPGTAGALFLIKEQEMVELAASWGDLTTRQEIFRPDDCWALRLGKAHLVNSAHPEPTCAHASSAGNGTQLCVPVIAHSEVMGILHLDGPMTEFADGKGEGESPVRLLLAQSFAERIGLAMADLRLRETLRNESVRDALTGLYNRRFMEETLEIEERRALRHGTAIGVIMLDIDHFKRFNDTYGHEAGDAVLRAIGQFLQDHVRDGDIACRFGGEEFTIILPGAGIDVARERGERLRERLSHLEINLADGQVGHVTASLGTAAFPLHGQSCQAVIKVADEALYQAKKQGRNRMVVADSTPHPQ